MMTYHIVVPDNIDPRAVDMLKQVETFTVDAPGQMTREQALEAVKDADALVIRSSTQVDAELISVARKLKVIARAGVGVDNVDLNAATARGIVVMNTPDGNTISTAEYTFGLMLALARKIPYGFSSLAAGRWDRKSFTGVELKGKTLGIVGFGRIGQAVAKRAVAFEMNVITYDPYVSAPVAESLGAKMVKLDELYAQADFITLHSVITDETREMINAETLAKMKKGVRIVNAARGALINEADLAEAIKNGHVAGAAVDVYTEEPPPADNPLIGLDNVIHTPHLAASTTDAQINVGFDAVQEVIDALTKGEYRNVVNPAALKK